MYVTYPVTYYCPHCETLVELQRDGYLEDTSVTPFPLDGWEYVSTDEEYEAADGVRFVCGADGSTQEPNVNACGRQFYLSFVRHGTTPAGRALGTDR